MIYEIGITICFVYLGYLTVLFAASDTQRYSVPSVFLKYLNIFKWKKQVQAFILISSWSFQPLKTRLKFRMQQLRGKYVHYHLINSPVNKMNFKIHERKRKWPVKEYFPTLDDVVNRHGSVQDQRPLLCKLWETRNHPAGDRINLEKVFFSVLKHFFDCLPAANICNMIFWCLKTDNIFITWQNTIKSFSDE